MIPRIQQMGPEALGFRVVRPSVRAQAEAFSRPLATDF